MILVEVTGVVECLNLRTKVEGNVARPREEVSKVEACSLLLNLECEVWVVA